MIEHTDQKRPAPISYRPPEDLRAEFHERVRASGLSTCAFITKAIFNRDPPRCMRRVSVEQQEIARLLAELAALREQLHVIAESGAADADAVNVAIDQLAGIRSACFKALGRAP